jgi:hypothetical protein
MDKDRLARRLAQLDPEEEVHVPGDYVRMIFGSGPNDAGALDEARRFAEKHGCDFCLGSDGHGPYTFSKRAQPSRSPDAA